MDIKNPDELVALYTSAGLNIELGIYPTAEQWQVLLSYPSDRKLHLASFFIFSSDPITILGSDSMEVYNSLNEKVGARDLYQASVKGTFTGRDEGTKWQNFSIKEFPSRNAFLDFLTDPRLLALQKKRSVFIEKQLTIILVPNE